MTWLRVRILLPSRCDLCYAALKLASLAWRHPNRRIFECDRCHG